MNNLTIDDFINIFSAVMPVRIPVEVDLWSVSEIAAFLKCSNAYAMATYLPLPGFPKAIRLPAPNGRKGHPKFKAKEVIAWANKYQENRAN